MTTVCAFDIGIKNLAFCVMRSRRILAWENVNILATEEPAVVPTTCHRCAVKAKWTCGAFNNQGDRGSLATPCCKRHLVAGFKPLGGDKPYTKVPAVKELKVIAGHAGKREELLATISKSWAIPIDIVKKKSAVHESLTTLHDGIRRCIEGRWETLKGVGLFLLENQPVLKNPTMKSVQILLFATIRDCFLGRGLMAPEMRLVHAGKKVRGAEVGDAGYADRKAAGELRAVAFCTGEATSWLPTINGAKKKNDLADALCMCLDSQE
jgi:hypothetical protein